jgi:CSLREA domain-containing protein
MKKSLLTAIAFALLTPGLAMGQATTYTVNATLDVDDGTCDVTHCSLREALNAANGNAGTDTVAFNVPGQPPYEIFLASELPEVTDPAVIDGSTQPGFDLDAIVVLDGTNAGTGADGLHISAGNSTVRYLVIGLFDGDGIVLDTNGGNQIAGSVIGAEFRFLDCASNGGSGVVISSSNNIIGGSASQERTVVGCNNSHGIEITGGDGNSILSSFVGTDQSGTEPLGNAADGIRVSNAPNTVIGGPGLTQGNLITLNGVVGVRLSGSGTADNTVTGNRITENSGKGIVLTATVGAGNTITSNSIWANGGLGIDLNNDGITANDDGDTDSGPNDLQNYPVIASALGLFPGIQFAGTINSTPNTTFDLEFFTGNACTPTTSRREGKELLDSTTVTTDAGGNASFTITNLRAIIPGEELSATATDPGGSTSELSACVPIVSFAVEVIPDSVVISRGSQATYRIDVVPLGGTFDGAVALSCEDLPGGTECIFEPDTLTPGSATVSARLDIPTLIFGEIASARDAERDRARALWLGLLGVGLPGIALLAMVVSGRGRRRHRFAVPAFVAVALLGIALSTACDDPVNVNVGGTPLGEHLFTVVATSGPITREAIGKLIVE